MEFTHQIHALQRLITRRGQKIKVYRPTKNQFGEDSAVKLILHEKGIFHEANSYLGVNVVNAGKVYSARQPMILLPYIDTIKKQDIMEIQGNRFRVTGLDDLGNLHLILDVSLEVEE